MSRNNKKRRQAESPKPAPKPDLVVPPGALAIPEVTDADVAFGGYPRDFFESAKRFDFADRTEQTRFEDIVNDLFFNGGQIPCGSTVAAPYKTRALRMFKAVVKSFEPSHEDKTRVCAAILKCIA